LLYCQCGPFAILKPKNRKIESLPLSLPSFVARLGSSIKPINLQPQTGVTLDHFAALVINNGQFQVISPPGKTGSVDGAPGLTLRRAAGAAGAAGAAAGAGAGAAAAAAEGSAAVEGGGKEEGSGGIVEVFLEVAATVPTTTGNGSDTSTGHGKGGNNWGPKRPLAEIFHPASSTITQDARVEVARAENPSHDL
jgi:hypothetical protein